MYTGPKIIKVTADNPANEAIDNAATVIKAGGTVVFPTRNLYGLGVDAFNPTAVAGLFSIKRRSAQKPILILINSIKQLEHLVIRVPGNAEKIMRRFWPGKVTLVFEADNSVSPELTGGSGKIGIRLPGHPAASALVSAVAGPITGTSANLSGSPGCHQINDLEPEVADRVDLILDAGSLEGGQGSTVVDVTGGKIPVILREGTISADQIKAAVGR
jgi:L-threonylcarbamoyladenylate synthase